MIFAHIGSKSPRRMPGTFVSIVPNSPRYSSGASGLGSHMSIWLGPPRIHRMMTEFASFRLADSGVAFASKRSKSARPKPAKPSMPARKKPRRSGAKDAKASRQPSEEVRRFTGILRQNDRGKYRQAGQSGGQWQFTPIPNAPPVWLPKKERLASTVDRAREPDRR